MRPFLSALLLSLAAAPTVQAADHGNLETSFPLEVEDAYPIGRNGIEAQILTRYRDLRDDPDGRNLVEVTPRIEWGAFANGQLTLELPYFLGNGSMAESGEVGIEALYNLNSESLRFPAFSAAAGRRIPTWRVRSISTPPIFTTSTPCPRNATTASRSGSATASR